MMLRKNLPFFILMVVVLQGLSSIQLAFAASLNAADISKSVTLNYAWKPQPATSIAAKPVNNLPTAIQTPSYAWKPQPATSIAAKPVNNLPTAVQTPNYAWKPQLATPVAAKPVNNLPTAIQTLNYAWKPQLATPVAAKPVNNLPTAIQTLNYAWKPQPATSTAAKPVNNPPTTSTAPSQPIEQQPASPAPVAPVTNPSTTGTTSGQPIEQQPASPAPIASVTNSPTTGTTSGQPTEQQPASPAPFASVTDSPTTGTTSGQPIEQQPASPVPVASVTDSPTAGTTPGQPIEQKSASPSPKDTGQHVITLHSKIIVLDPGHGGSNPGAVENGVKEADINLAVSLELRDKLVPTGAKVIMTRETNCTVAPEGKTLGEELQARVDIAEINNADIFVSIHSNSNPDPSITGAMSFYPQAKASDLASVIQKSIVQATGIVDKGISDAAFYVLQKTSMPSVLIEMGFISNREEAVRLQDKEYRAKIVQGLFNGIVNYFAAS